MNDKMNVKLDQYVQSGMTMPEMPIPYGWKGNEYQDSDNTYVYGQEALDRMIDKLKEKGYFTRTDARRAGYSGKILAAKLRYKGMSVRYRKSQDSWILGIKTVEDEIYDYIKDNEPVRFKELKSKGYAIRSIYKVVHSGLIDNVKGTYAIKR